MVDRSDQRVGNYRLMRLLGAGIWAEVYLGEHIRLRTQVAIKVLRAQLHDGGLERLFLQEVKASMQLIHPHIVRVLEFGMEGRTPYFVMDYALNGSLRQRHASTSRVSMGTVISYVWQLAEALQYAHSEKVVHRDVKPENMLVGRYGEILLSDFGLSIALPGAHLQGRPDLASALAYMAPEQLYAPPSAASDQYSLALAVYEWLMGRRPLASASGSLDLRSGGIPFPVVQGSGLPLEVERVLKQALARKPQERFPSVQSFAQALELAGVGRAVSGKLPAVSLPPPRSEHMPAVQPALLPPSPPLRLPSSQEVRPLAETTGPLSARFPLVGHLVTMFRGHSASVNALAWSPDGTRIVSAGDGRRFCVWEAGSGRLLRESTTYRGDIQSVLWSLDGASIVLGGKEKSILVLDAQTFTEKTYKEHKGSVNALTGSPDGFYIASGSDDGLVHIWEKQSWRPVLSYRGHKDEGSKIFALDWSPNRACLVSGGESSRVRVWQPGRTEPIYVYQGHSGSVYAVRWSPDSQSIASGGNGGIVRIWNALNGEKVCWYSGHSGRVQTLAWQPSGKACASGDSGGTLHVWNATSGQLIYAYAGHKGGIRTLAWSPNGRYLASAGEDRSIQIWHAP